MTPLHVAAKKGESLEIVEYLIDKDAHINIQNNNKVNKTTLQIQHESAALNVLFAVRKASSSEVNDFHLMVVFHPGGKAYRPIPTCEITDGTPVT